ncbi:hypothetical protein SAMN02910413_0286 [Pseudobutyrivibrio sp. C4]|uniref:hypothetical protein n=1 Tax=Pseudobutyrivibrio sp. C4 TaxID=1520803 RepID=UPI0008BB846D|nr:hypothetical protein [Pseudobutyrivibrio sp. C4]SES64967.1 hypothetical protein SAMN02910413_0286 [Pseudobutyrivibrio sp. C4]
MDAMVPVKDDQESANEYFEVYMSLRAALREGKIETTDVEEYLAYKKRMLPKKAREIAQEMILKIDY